MVLFFSVFLSIIEVDSQELQSGTQEAQFTVTVKEEDSVRFFCCLYKDQGGRYSLFSHYLQVEQPKGV